MYKYPVYSDHGTKFKKYNIILLLVVSRRALKEIRDLSSSSILFDTMIDTIIKWMLCFKNKKLTKY